MKQFEIIYEDKDGKQNCFSQSAVDKTVIKKRFFNDYGLSYKIVNIKEKETK